MALLEFGGDLCGCDKTGMASVTMKEQAEMISIAMTGESRGTELALVARTVQAENTKNSGTASVTVTGDPMAQRQHSWP